MQDIEKHILQLFHNGDPSAMQTLYASFAGYVAGVCSRYAGNKEDLHDVMQESFIKIMTKLSSFHYRGKGSLKAWIGKIAVNESLRFIKQSNPFMYADIDTHQTAETEEEPDVSKLTMQEMASLIEQLPIGYRTVFNLYAIDGHSHKEIATMLNISPSTSASQFLRARHMLAATITLYLKKEEKL